ncbi:hypothetical protein [Haliscomenobacter sp.]|uniref:hypothetical protein n=1 Tax=Haliscomenobacter sp. TaxID=2717303 RepID=UPI003593E2A1
MPNTNANVYPALGINAQNQVFGVDANNNIHTLSNEGFAQVIAISENGTIWAISTDPLSGGAQLSWSTGDGNWTAFSNVPGAVLLTGSRADSALYYTESQTLWTIQTSGQGEQIGQMPEVQDLDYGGGYLWMIAPIAPNGDACLQFTSMEGPMFNWKPFSGYSEPSSISVNYAGNCYGVDGSFSPMYYLNDGVSTGSAGDGATTSSLEVSFKNTFYVLSTNGNEKGNDVLVYKGDGPGSFVSAGFQAIQVLGTYYSAS